MLLTLKLINFLFQLCRYSDGHFLEEALNYFSLTEGEVFVLDTPLMVYVRVIPSVWSEEVPSNPLTVAKVSFMSLIDYILYFTATKGCGNQLWYVSARVQYSALAFCVLHYSLVKKWFAIFVGVLDKAEIPWMGTCCYSNQVRRATVICLPVPDMAACWPTPCGHGNEFEVARRIGSSPVLKRRPSEGEFQLGRNSLGSFPFTGTVSLLEQNSFMFVAGLVLQFYSLHEAHRDADVTCCMEYGLQLLQGLTGVTSLLISALRTRGAGSVKRLCLTKAL